MIKALLHLEMVQFGYGHGMLLIADMIAKCKNGTRIGAVDRGYFGQF